MVSRAPSMDSLSGWFNGRSALASTIAEISTIGIPENSPPLLAALSQLGVLAPQDAGRLPSFMIVAPPKTGTSWLFARLLEHPEVSMPPEKETRFFSSFYQWCDLRWYLSRFPRPSAAQRGEATPTYAILPPSTIQVIRALVPNLKLVFLLRDPADRGWSHARHNWRYAEANFVDSRPPLESMSVAAWRENFEHPWPSISGDYLGQLRRWRQFFPKRQVFVGLFDDIVARPQALLDEICGFLGLSPIAVSQPALRERVNEGLAVAANSQVMSKLRNLYAARTRELAEYLTSEFAMNLPASWNETLMADPADAEFLAGPMKTAAQHEFDDHYLLNVIQHEHPLEQVVPFEETYMGYKLLLCRERVYGLAEHLPQTLLTSDPDALKAAEQRGDCVSGPNMVSVRERIAQVLINGPKKRF